MTPSKSWSMFFLKSFAKWIWCTVVWYFLLKPKYMINADDEYFMRSIFWSLYFPLFFLSLIKFFIAQGKSALDKTISDGINCSDTLMPLAIPFSMTISLTVRFKWIFPPNSKNLLSIAFAIWYIPPLMYHTPNSNSIIGIIV